MGEKIESDSRDVLMMWPLLDRVLLLPSSSSLRFGRQAVGGIIGGRVESWEEATVVVVSLFSRRRSKRRGEEANAAANNLIIQCQQAIKKMDHGKSRRTAAQSCKS